MPSHTPDADLKLVYPPSFIPASVTQQLPSGLHLRPLSTTDHKRGHLKVLTILTVAPNLTPDVYEEVIGDMMLRGKGKGGYYPLVIIDKANDQIIGCGTLLVERKFIRNGGMVGHIEDIAVDPKQQGKKLGLRIIQALTGVAEGLGCYKTILDCSKDNIPFYEKCGFTHKEYEMVKYAPESSHNSRIMANL